TFPFVCGSSARARARTDAYPVYAPIVFLRQARRRAVTQTLCRFIKDQHRADHSITRLRLDATHQAIEHRRERRAGSAFFQYSFFVGQRVLRTSALSDIAKAPDTTNVLLLDQLNRRISHEDAAVLQLYNVESFECGRGNDLVDPRQMPDWIFQLRA